MKPDRGLESRRKCLVIRNARGIVLRVMLVTCVYSAPGSLVGDRLCLLYSASGEDVTVPALLLDLYSGGSPGHAPECEADNFIWGFAGFVEITKRPKRNLLNRTADVDPGLAQIALADAQPVR